MPEGPHNGGTDEARRRGVAMSVSESPDGTGTDGPSSQVTVGDLMRAPTTTVEPGAHVAAAAYLMKRSQDSALVVTTDEADRLPIAVITDADISQAVADGWNVNDTRINQLRLARPAPVAPTTPVNEAAERMLTMSLMHLPVVDDGRLVGLVDIAAVCRALLQQSQPTGQRSVGPARLRADPSCEGWISVQPPGGPAGHRCRGSSTRARVTPSAEVSVSRPLCRWATTASEVARPSPVPCPTGLVVKKASKARARTSGGTVGPVFSTSTTT